MALDSNSAPSARLGNARHVVPKTAFQDEGSRIFTAQRAAARLLARTQAAHTAVLSMSRDELAALAQQMAAVSSIAEKYHLERASIGSLSPDAFPSGGDDA